MSGWRFGLLIRERLPGRSRDRTRRANQRLRFASAAATFMLVNGSVWAQPASGTPTPEQRKAIPPEILKYLPPDIWSKIPLSTLQAIPPGVFAKIPPDLLAKIPPNAATMTPDQAKAYYRGLDPSQKQSLKEQAKQIKAQIDGVPGLMDKLKALLRSLLGS